MIRTSARLAVVAAIATAMAAATAGTASAADPDRPGLVRNGNTWLLRDALSGGPATTTFAFGSTSDVQHVTGDWDGNGTRTPGIVRQVGDNWVWYLRNSNSAGATDVGPFAYGKASVATYDLPIVGDWDGDGRDGVGVVRGDFNATHVPKFLLRQTASGGAAQVSFGFGFGDFAYPVVGDWDGNGTDTVGLVDRHFSNGRSGWYLRNANSAGVADIQFEYGNAYDQPVIGDWDGDGKDGVGMVRVESGRYRWLLRQTATPGSVQVSFVYGTDRDRPVTWS